jgi:outer membrane protein assembly factor BamB
MKRKIQVGLAIIVGFFTALVHSSDDRLVFKYATYDRGFWEGDCQCPSPKASDDTLYFCGGYTWKDKEKLVAIDLQSKKEKWHIDMPNSCGPLLVKDNVIYKWDGTTLSAFDTTGKQIWKLSGLFGLPFVIDNRLYLSSKEKSAFLVLDTRDWKKIDEIPLPEIPDSTPLVDGNMVYFGTRSGKIISLNLQDKTTKASQRATRILSPLVKRGAALIFNAEVPGGFSLIAFDLEEKTVKWSVNTKVLTQSRPVIFGDKVFFGSNRLYSVHVETGKFQTYDMSGGPVGNPVISGNTLYVAGGKFMHAVNPATGSIISKFGADEWIDAPPTAGPPTVRDGVIYFGSLDCNVYGIRTQQQVAGQPAAAPDASRR